MADAGLVPLAGGVEFKDEFRIEQTLGQGAFGITYLVTALKSEEGAITAGNRYVVKEFAVAGLVRRGENGLVITANGNRPEEVEHNQAEFERLRSSFEEEARTLLRFSHKNIVEVLLVREGNGTSYIVMEYVNGQSLSQRLDATLRSRGAPMNWVELEPIATALLDATQHIHDRDVIHRDIKPANIMLRANGSPVLIDFGGARPTERAHSSIILTPGFAPAEQYPHLGGNANLIGKPTDIYSLAAVLYVALTGELPYTLDEQRRPVAVRQPLLGHPNQILMALPDNAARAIDWALDFMTPAHRPQTVQQWRPAFTAVMPAPAPQPAPQPAPTPRPAPPKPEERPSSPLAIVGVTLGAVGVIGALVVAGWFYLLQQKPADDVVAIELQLGREWVPLAEAVAGDTARPLAPMTPDALARFDLAVLDKPDSAFAILADKAIRVRYRDASNGYRVLRADSPGAFPQLAKGVLASRLEVRAEDQGARLWIVDQRGAGALP
jgi:serine/threonine protein kinase